MQGTSSSCARCPYFLCQQSAPAPLQPHVLRVAVPAFDPSSAAAAKQHAALLGASEEHLGNLLAELYAAMPSLAACGFRASFGKQLQATSALMRQASSSRHEASAAAAAPTLGVDMQALQALVAKAREALAEISA